MLKNRVPEAHTDYIVSVISEEFGVIVIILLMIVFLFFIYQVFKKLYFDSVLFAPKALDYLCSCCGANRVILGSDYPFPIGDGEPLKIIESADLDNSQKQMILGDTAASLFF